MHTGLWNSCTDQPLPSAKFALVQYLLEDGDTDLGILVSGEVLQRPDWVTCSSVMEMLEDWGWWKHTLLNLDVDSLTPLGPVTLVEPLTYPGKILCVGANYYDHAAEMGTKLPSPDAEPYFFLKSPATTFVGPLANIELPECVHSTVDWEVELGVVIGYRCKSISERDAAGAIAGYLVANDLSDRGLFHRESSIFPAFDWDWVAQKNQDGFCPAGPGLVPAFLVDDPQSLRIRLEVNGVTKQDSNTAQMITDINRLVSSASKRMTLEPGDIILTGTPAGVGLSRNEFLAIGDVVSAEVESIGRISNRIIRKQYYGQLY
ncbi:fumarylacetoacetate hydrolase family protein [Mycobacteroides abscessus]|uniref:fumarylacetoacetate hydrolase family protein n=1 Tax=Mycobacteroides abscessus TaxID=36809 RepID=UPI0009CF1FE5|nr:fumarylacetoacetate hydrolase family protein [Mycobacteroides abscessus]SLF47708.1 5-carboxymethyl-2-hydroxymuconate delta-isomerase [Mycobacteroides abscessus subsp. abscessus]